MASDPQPPDYKAEAQAWLEQWIWGHIDQANHRDKKFPRHVEATESLAALLERLCGAAREEGRREQREKDARAMCGPCADGWEVKCGVEDGKPNLWYHPTQKDRGGQICHAAAIREAKP